MSFQMILEAFDSDVRDDVVTTIITVTVERNNYRPRFSLSAYKGRIFDYDPPGTSVGQVHATDDDIQVHRPNQILCDKTLCLLCDEY